MRIAGLVLAGGRGSRLKAEGPKPLVMLGGRPLVAHVLARLEGHADPILLGANDVAAFAVLGLPVVPDRREGFAGPLAGLDAAAHWLAAQRPTVSHVLAVPGDTPFLPPDIAARMTKGAGVVTRVAMRDGALQPAVALWTVEALGRLPAFLNGSGKTSIRRFLDETGFETVEIGGHADAPKDDPFFNVNTPEDLQAARAFLAGG